MDNKYVPVGAKFVPVPDPDADEWWSQPRLTRTYEQKRELEQFDLSSGVIHRFFNKQLTWVIKQSTVHRGDQRDGTMFDRTYWHTEGAYIATIGTEMERNAELIKAVNVEVTESKKMLKTALNEIMAVDDLLQPKLLEMIRRCRESRMAALTEVRGILSELKDVRKFFLDAEHTDEIERLERFVKVCLQLKALKEDGTLDALADTMLKLEGVCTK